MNQSAQGTDKVNAIINCHLATGRIGRPGMGPFSLTGQPNAMGGREVGGLANQLAAHMDFSPESVDRVGRFWQAPHMASREGLKAVALFDAVAAGKVKALWVMGTNPAVSLPRADGVREALRGLDFLVVSDNVAANDTLGCRPHLVLPALAWGEKDGTVTNSERRISRQRAFLSPPGEAKPDWWAIAQVGKRLGHGAAFAWRSAAEVFREHAALSAFENEGTRDFDLSGLAGLNDAAFDALRAGAMAGARGRGGRKRFFAEGGFYTPDRKARFVPPRPPALARATSEAYPFLLNTGRIRDQWHTMTRSGLSARLGAHLPVPFAEINAEDAARLGVTDGAMVRVASAHGALVVEARLAAGQPRGTLFVPIHWSEATSSCGRVGALVAGDTDPISGQPEAKATPVALEPVVLPYRGFVLSRQAIAPPPAQWWARATLDGAIAYILADDRPPQDWVSDMAGRRDARGGASRRCRRRALPLRRFRRGRPYPLRRLRRALGTPSRLGRRAVMVRRRGAGRRPARKGALGRAESGGACGPVICACHGVAQDSIEAFIAGNPAAGLAGIGAALKAGTNCGSCIPELRRLLARTEPALG